MERGRGWKIARATADGFIADLLLKELLKAQLTPDRNPAIKNSCDFLESAFNGSEIENNLAKGIFSVNPEHAVALTRWDDCQMAFRRLAQEGKIQSGHDRESTKRELTLYLDVLKRYGFNIAGDEEIFKRMKYFFAVLSDIYLEKTIAILNQPRRGIV